MTLWNRWPPSYSRRIWRKDLRGLRLLDLVPEREHRVEIHGNIVRRGQGLGQLGRHFVVLGEPGFHSRPVTGSFENQQLLSQLSQHSGQLRVVDGVASGG